MGLNPSLSLIRHIDRGQQTTLVAWLRGQTSLLPISMNIVCGCFFTTKAETNNHDRDQMAHKAVNIYYLVLYRKNYANP